LRGTRKHGVGENRNCAGSYRSDSRTGGGNAQTLSVLEGAKLITIERHDGQKHMVTIREIQEKSSTPTNENFKPSKPENLKGNGRGKI
jgi:hypothetical protein